LDFGNTLLKQDIIDLKISKKGISVLDEENKMLVIYYTPGGHEKVESGRKGDLNIELARKSTFDAANLCSARPLEADWTKLLKDSVFSRMLPPT